MQKGIAHVIGLENSKRWDYLGRYYKLAEKFYGVKDDVVSDKEIDDCIKKLKQKPCPKIRKEKLLKDWKFMMDHENKGTEKGYHFHNYDDSAWNSVHTPHAFQHVPENPVAFGKTDFFIYTTKEYPCCTIWRGDTHAWYKTNIPLDDVGENEVAYLQFDSVNLNSDVWVNEYPVMMDHLGLFPFKVEITEEIRVNHPNDPEFAVRVSSTASNMPHAFYNGFQYAYTGKRFTGDIDRFDWVDLAWAGIAGDVTVSVLNKNHIENTFIHTDKIGANDAVIGFDITLRNQTQNKFSGSIEIEISPWSPEEGSVIHKAELKASSLPMNDTVINIPVKLDNPKLWTPDTPNLYLAHIILKAADGSPIDDTFETLGIRTFEMKGPHFYLNGKKTVLRGLHDSCHYQGEPVIYPGEKILVKDLLLQKKMGVNCSRWPSDIRIHDKRIAQYCDQVGLMLSWAGFFEIWKVHPDAAMLASRDIRTMIRDLRNHPSIVIWEMGDEILFHIYEYHRIQYTGKIYDFVLEADPTRPIIPTGDCCTDLLGYVQDYPDKNLPMDERRKRVLEEYPLFNREKIVWDIHHLPFPAIIELPHAIAEALAGEKPTVFTEFGYDALPNPDNVRDIYDKFRWQANPFVNINKEEQDMKHYGRHISPADWKETQAMQALITCDVINILRQYPDAFAAYYFLTMFDLWTYYWGAVDVHGNCKLLYFTAKSHFAPVFISALHGNAIVKKTDVLDISVSNYEKDIKGATFKIIIRDKNDKIAYQNEKGNVNVPGDVSLTVIEKINLSQLPQDLYSFEYYLNDKDGNSLGKMLELAYLE